MCARTWIAGLLALWGAYGSADYTVQIGAFAKPDQEYAKAASTLASVQSTVVGDGVTRISAGQFATKADALALRDKLVDLGYADAFVRKADGAATTPVSEPSADPKQTVFTSGEGVAQLVSAYETLPGADREKLVYLDGALYIKEGDIFTPYKEYRRGR